MEENYLSLCDICGHEIPEDDEQPTPDRQTLCPRCYDRWVQDKCPFCGEMLGHCACNKEAPCEPLS